MKRKLIDIKDEDFIALSIKATKAGKLLKPYIEDLLSKDAKNELYLISSSSEQLVCNCQGCGEVKAVEYCEKCYAENLPDIAN